MSRKLSTVRPPRPYREKLETLEDVKRKFNTLPLDRWSWPSENIHDEPTRCIRINLEWWPVVVGWLSLLAQPRVWENVLTTDAHPVQQILQLMIGEECGMFELRQNPDDTCLIEQTFDGGDTWVTAFDLSLCLSIVDGSNPETTINNFQTNTFAYFQENIYNFFIDNYINNITDLVPELGYGDDDDYYRNDALCFALERFVDVISEQAIAYFDALEETSKDLRTNLAIAVAIIGIIALAATGVGTPAALVLASQAALWGAGIGLGTALGVSLFDHFTDTNRAAYTDLEARAEVVCCLLDNLRGANVNRDTFEAAFTCSGLSTEAQAIHDASGILAAEDATYAALVENMRIGFNSSKLGLLPNCQCAPDGWFWQDVPWEWSEPNHSGNRQSPIFEHTNPSNGELISITASYQTDNPPKTGIRAANTGEGDALVLTTPLKVGVGIRLWENSFVGVFEGADIIEFPSGRRKHTSMSTALRQPDVTFTFRWADNPDLGHSASTDVTNIRLLYKEV